ncbi:hypothetical protein DL96DRAFT_1577538 [Flagelloscypha sp. PMI_526]|nr:hypothetical protein DL96DRAFT_1577538 [Flagelloscypha sp. PMI_526]
MPTTLLNFLGAKESKNVSDVASSKEGKIVTSKHKRDSSTSTVSTAASSQIDSPTESLADRLLKFKPFRPKSVITLGSPKRFRKKKSSEVEGEYEKASHSTALSRQTTSSTIESMSCFLPFRDAEDGIPHDFPENPECTQLSQGNVSPTQVQISQGSELWISEKAQLVDPFKRTSVKTILPTIKANARLLERGHRKMSVSLLVPPTEVTTMLQRRRSHLMRAKSTDWSAPRVDFDTNELRFGHGYD